MTSKIPLGTLSALQAVPRAIVCGKRKLPATATKAARNVESIYKKITDPKRRSILPEPLTNADVTKAKTNIGAIPLNAPIKILPMISNLRTFGTVSAKSKPIAKPQMILTTRLVSLYFLMIFIHIPLNLNVATY